MMEPTTPPTIACVVETGTAVKVARSKHTAAAIKAPNTPIWQQPSKPRTHHFRNAHTQYSLGLRDPKPLAGVFLTLRVCGERGDVRKGCQERMRQGKDIKEICQGRASREGIKEGKSRKNIRACQGGTSRKCIKKGHQGRKEIKEGWKGTSRKEGRKERTESRRIKREDRRDVCL
jgi:hypothetical protein